MEKRQFVSDLHNKDEVESFFLVKYIAVMAGRDGRSYLNLVLADSSGDLEARRWSHAEESFKRVQKGSYVKVKGKINLYQSRFQLIVKDLVPIPADSVKPEDYLRQSQSDPERMFEELLTIADQMGDCYLRDLLQMVLMDAEIKRRLTLWPAGKSIHHAFTGGLLEHILSCARLAMLITPNYQEVNRDYVVAGAVLHDICKIYELSDGPVVEYTDEGRLVGHLVNGVQLLDRFISKMPHFPSQSKMHLEHILVSHHGSLEHGSTKPPQTREAQLVHFIDLIDSQMNSFQTAIENDRGNSDWTGYIKHLDRMLYKGKLRSISQPLELEGGDDEGGTPKVKAEGSPTHSMADQLKNFKV
ncbi:MAG: HD domain-containing protein [Bdellovibrionales bacterium]|nr:HD domain-containing protein [Bdellovibrionales bacterium]MBT3524934.1 HD domain-containing protein [Bdellovibrionales bacterium]MBT7766976.1 HD domain-containing protein [Bdellovibrionales bacterium]